MIGTILLWMPMMGLVRLFDRDPARYRTGYLFRKLGHTMTKLIPNVEKQISYDPELKGMRRPVVVVSNHLSNGDIPLISNLPFEMKWVAKKALFKLPVVGWMMNWAGDIKVDRKASDRRKKTFVQAEYYLKNDCPVMFFPEGTRSRNGKLNRFTTGAFDLAVKHQIPVLPVVIDGTQDYLPKNTWKFGKASTVKLEVLPFIHPEGLTGRELTDKVRGLYLNKLSEWRGVGVEEVDNTV